MQTAKAPDKTAQMCSFVWTFAVLGIKHNGQEVEEVWKNE